MKEADSAAIFCAPRSLSLAFHELFMSIQDPFSRIEFLPGGSWTEHDILNIYLRNFYLQSLLVSILYSLLTFLLRKVL